MKKIIIKLSVTSFHYNTPEGSKERQRTRRLKLKNELEVVEILNERLADIPAKDKKFIQRFLNDYQNLSHYWSVMGGWRK